MVVPPRVEGRDRIPVAVLRRMPDEPLALRMSQRGDGAVEALPGELLGLAGARAESGAPEEALGLSRPEVASIDGNFR